MAHRPWPRPIGTAALGAALAGPPSPGGARRARPDGVAARAPLRGERAGVGLGAVVELVLRRTAGVPALVDRLLDALIEQAGPDRSRLGDPARTPPGLLAQLGYAMQAQPAGVRGLLLARRSARRSRPRCWSRCSA